MCFDDLSKTLDFEVNNSAVAEVVVEMTLELVATLPATMLGEEVDLTGVLTDTLFGSTIFDAWTAANEVPVEP